MSKIHAGDLRRSIQPARLWSADPLIPWLTQAAAHTRHQLLHLRQGQTCSTLIPQRLSWRREFRGKNSQFSRESRCFLWRHAVRDHLVMGVLNNPPDLVVMFATKFDLLSRYSPQDADGKAAERMASAFAKHRELIENACNKNRVPFVWVLGSAVRGWGIEQLRKSLTRVIGD